MVRSGDPGRSRFFLEKDGSAMLEMPLSSLARLNGRIRRMPQSLSEMDGSSMIKSRMATNTMPPMMQPTMSMRFDDGMSPLTALSLPEVLAGSGLAFVAVAAGCAVVDSITMPGPCRGGVASGETAVGSDRKCGISCESSSRSGWGG